MGYRIPQQYQSRHLLQKCVIWCTVSGIGIVGLVFLSDTGTVASDRYRDVLEDDFLPFHQGMGVQFEEMFFQQDRNRLHTGNVLLDAVSILAIVLCLIPSLHIQAVYGLGHNILPSSTPAITCYGGIWKTICTETIAHSWWAEKRNAICCHHNNCRV
jgi:hypothetical protein